MSLLIAAVATFMACFVLMPAIFWLLRFFGFYAIVEERTCNGKSIASGSRWLPRNTPQSIEQ